MDFPFFSSSTTSIYTYNILIRFVYILKLFLIQFSNNIKFLPAIFFILFFSTSIYFLIFGIILFIHSFIRSFAEKVDGRMEVKEDEEEEAEEGNEGSQEKKRIYNLLLLTIFSPFEMIFQFKNSNYSTIPYHTIHTAKNTICMHFHFDLLFKFRKKKSRISNLYFDSEKLFSWIFFLSPVGFLLLLFHLMPTQPEKKWFRMTKKYEK